MTKLILRLFVKDSGNTDDPKIRATIGRLSGGVGIFCNLLLAVFKLAVGILCGSVSITADAMNNVTDAASSIVTLVGFKLAERPADSEHPYGHARYEYLSGLAVAALIIVIGFELAKTSVEKIFSPAAVVLTIPAVVVLIGAILVKLWMSAFNRRLGKHIDSATLLATAVDSRNDVVATGAVLLAAGVEALTGWQIDGFVGVGVALFILYSGITLAKQTISPLLGEAASPQLRKVIVEVVSQNPLVLGYHDLMVHDYGPGQRFASIHVEMDKKEDPLLCHEIIDDMERECLEKHNVHLVIHYDPIVTGDAEVETMRHLVTSLLQQMDTRLSIHDFRMVKGVGHSNLIFDVLLPPDLEGQELQIKHGLEKALAAKNQGIYHTVITFDPAFFNDDPS